MNDISAPERIWATEDAANYGEDRFHSTKPMRGLTGYIRADLHQAALDRAEADKVAAVEERKFYHKDWSIHELLKARNDGMLTDDGEAWRYRFTHMDGIGGKYDMLFRRALPTPAPMTVAQAARVLLADVIANCGTDEDAWLPVLDGILRHCDGDRNNAMSGLVAALAAITEAKP